MKRIFLILVTLMSVVGVVVCSETDNFTIVFEDVDDYSHWLIENSLESGSNKISAISGHGLFGRGEQGKGIGFGDSWLFGPTNSYLFITPRNPTPPISIVFHIKSCNYEQGHFSCGDTEVFIDGRDTNYTMLPDGSTSWEKPFKLSIYASDGGCFYIKAIDFYYEGMFPGLIFNEDNYTYQVLTDNNVVLCGVLDTTVVPMSFVPPTTTTYDDEECNITAIGDYVFAGCTRMQSITLGRNINSIGVGAFDSCCALTKVVLPDPVTEVKDYTFRNCSTLTSVTIDEAVTSIGKGAFAGCSSLPKIDIPFATKSITNDAFSGCKSLTTIKIPKQVTTIGSRVFKGCTGLISVSLGSKVANVGTYAFDSCCNLTSINFPSGVTEIMDGTFRYCKNLVLTDIPDQITSIGDSAFKYCDALEDVTFGTGLQTIGDCAFKYCNSLTRLTIPSNVNSIGSSAFVGCSNSLTSIMVDANNTTFDSRENCNAIIRTSDNTLVLGCATTVIPNSVTRIGTEAFYDCVGLKSLNIHKNISSIGADAFYGTDLETITVDEDNNTFDNHNDCNAVLETATNTLVLGCKNTIIPRSVTSIADHAFGGCKGLTSISIPGSVATIANNAFEGCENLRAVYLNNWQALNTTPFQNLPADCKFFVPCGDEEQCKSAWSAFADRIYGFNNTLILHVNDVTMGTASFVTPFTCESNNATITAVANNGFEFVKWAEDNNPNATRSVPVEGDMTLTAVFQPATNCTLTLSCDAERGSVTGAGTYANGTSVEIMATANPGYVFSQWNDGVEDNPRTVVLNKDITLTAEFIVDVPTPVEEVTSDDDTSATRKVLRDGQLLIIHNGEEYSVTGCKLRIKN